MANEESILFFANRESTATTTICQSPSQRRFTLLKQYLLSITILYILIVFQVTSYVVLDLTPNQEYTYQVRYLESCIGFYWARKLNPTMPSLIPLFYQSWVQRCFGTILEPRIMPIHVFSIWAVQFCMEISGLPISGLNLCLNLRITHVLLRRNIFQPTLFHRKIYILNIILNTYLPRYKSLTALNKWKKNPIIFIIRLNSKIDD